MTTYPRGWTGKDDVRPAARNWNRAGTIRDLADAAIVGIERAFARAGVTFHDRPLPVVPKLKWGWMYDSNLAGSFAIGDWPSDYPAGAEKTVRALAVRYRWFARQFSRGAFGLGILLWDEGMTASPPVTGYTVDEWLHTDVAEAMPDVPEAQLARELWMLGRNLAASVGPLRRGEHEIPYGTAKWEEQNPGREHSVLDLERDRGKDAMGYALTGAQVSENEKHGPRWHPYHFLIYAPGSPGTSWTAFETKQGLEAWVEAYGLSLRGKYTPGSTFHVDIPKGPLKLRTLRGGRGETLQVLEAIRKRLNWPRLADGYRMNLNDGTFEQDDQVPTPPYEPASPGNWPAEEES